MHFEVLVEDASGKAALEILIPKIININQHSFLVHSYKGIGRIPKNMRDAKEAHKRILLDNLPKLLKGYGKTFKGNPCYPSAVVVVCDLDDKCLIDFRNQLNNILEACSPRPETRFCFAIEEGEAWFLGDIPAIRRAYPRSIEKHLRAYINDSICGTWEVLADAVVRGGRQALVDNGWQAIGREKSRWAAEISPHMTIANNKSPSFCYFVSKMLELIEGPDEL